MSIENYVSELCGYLKAFQRMRGNYFAFGARYFLHKEEMDKFVSEITNANAEYCEIGYKQVLDNLERIIFGGLLSKQALANDDAWNYTRKMFVEDLIDFYEMIPFSLGSGNERPHAFIDGPIYMLARKVSGDRESFVYWLQIENHYILTYSRCLS